MVMFIWLTWPTVQLHLSLTHVAHVKVSRGYVVHNMFYVVRWSRVYNFAITIQLLCHVLCKYTIYVLFLCMTVVPPW